MGRGEPPRPIAVRGGITPPRPYGTCDLAGPPPGERAATAEIAASPSGGTGPARCGRPGHSQEKSEPAMSVTWSGRVSGPSWPASAASAGEAVSTSAAPTATALVPMYRAARRAMAPAREGRAIAGLACDTSWPFFLDRLPG